MVFFVLIFTYLFIYIIFKTEDMIDYFEEMSNILRKRRKHFMKDHQLYYYYLIQI